jgi:hypothetical protein
MTRVDESNGRILSFAVLALVCATISFTAPVRGNTGIVAERRHRDETPAGAPPGRDPELRLHDALGDEAKRVVTDPRDEAERLGKELGAGRSEATPLIAMSVVGVGVGVVVAVVIALAVLAIYLS